jgi:hypothetical protein
MYGNPEGIASLKITRPTVVLMTRRTSSCTVARRMSCVSCSCVRSIKSPVNAQLDGRLGRHILGIEREENFFLRSEHAAFALGAFAIARQVVNTQHDVL